MAVRSPLPGGGPWLVSVHCDSPRHNTLTTARKSRARKSRARNADGTKCICPRAIFLLLEHRRVHDSAEKVSERRRDLSRRNVRLPTTAPEPVAVTQPDFRFGLCTTRWGQDTARQGMNDEVSRAGIAARQRAKNLCNVGPCPLRDRCRAWVLGHEKPAGSWGGVWGGLDPWNRRGTEVIMKDGKAALIPYAID